MTKSRETCSQPQSGNCNGAFSSMKKTLLATSPTVHMNTIIMLNRNDGSHVVEKNEKEKAAYKRLRVLTGI